VTQQTFSGKTGNGSVSLGGSFTLDDIEIVVTAITNHQVRQGPTVNSTIKLQYAGSYGSMFDGADGNLVTSWHQICFDHQDFGELAAIGITHLFWMLRSGVTATLKVTYH
jgi:hypothetical protein